MTARDRRAVIALDKYRRDREQRDEVARVHRRAVEMYGADVVASWRTCPACQLPMHPAATVNPDGEPFDAHPGCSSASTNSERNAA